MELMDVWAHGFCLARGYAPPVHLITGLWIEMARPELAGHVILNSAEMDCLFDKLSVIVEPCILVDVPATAQIVESQLPAGWTIKKSSFLMTRQLGVDEDRRPVDRLFDIRLNYNGSVHMVAAITNAGVYAASGMAVDIYGHAVFDDVHTSQVFRRQGLGSSVMGHLSRALQKSGTATGILMATLEGRALYEAIGWSVVSEVTTVLSPWNGWQSH